MHRYLVKRDVPGIGSVTSAQIRDGAAVSNSVIDELGSGIQWIQSLVTADRVYSEYLADSEELVREHARLSGFHAAEVSLVIRSIDPMAGNADSADRP